ncbi:uncharacterized protein LOC143018986 isoform X1 [Oratosquilla oratoria]|uniref:uncharacterized protein LOC143018986 isoform X1 n=1 Tax=Oratosquilla oratoria TaxID=337810 RepID=UPI003F7652C3
MWEPLADPSMLMPPLHIKLGLMNQFMKAFNQQSATFKYLLFFPKFSEAKIKGGIFVGPQIKKVLESTEFSNKINRIERTAWNYFIAVVKGFLGNYIAENYQQLVQDLVKAFGAMGCKMSLKVHMLDAHQDKFKDNFGAYSEVQGERFLQDMKEIEWRYQGHHNKKMMGDYIWGLAGLRPGLQLQIQEIQSFLMYLSCFITVICFYLFIFDKLVS